MTLHYYSPPSQNNPGQVVRAATAGGIDSANKIIATNASGYVDSSLYSLNGTLDLGGIKYTRSATPPTAPASGDLWDELANDFIPWRYNGTNWISRQIFQKYHTAINIGTSGTDYLIAIDYLTVRHNISLIAFATTTRVPTANSGTAFWTLALLRIASDGTAVTMASTNTSLSPINNFAKNKELVNLTIDTTNVVTFSARFTKTGAPGNLFAGVGVSFRWVR